MQAVKDFEKTKYELGKSHTWADMIGKEYDGGGGGFGKVRSLNIKSCEIYYQEYNGATNYHGIPEGLKGHLENAILSNFKNLLSQALTNQENELRELAAKAAEEYKLLMQAAGIEE